MQIGSFGDIIFEVSERSVRTFYDFLQRAGSRWSIHEPIASAPRPEYLGPVQGDLEFTMRLSSSLGLDPAAEKAKMETLAREGTHAPLLLGNRPVSEADWYIESCETTLLWVNGRGGIDLAEMKLLLKEYPIIPAQPQTRAEAPPQPRTPYHIGRGGQAVL